MKRAGIVTGWQMEALSKLCTNHLLYLVDLLSQWNSESELSNPSLIIFSSNIE